MALPQDGRKGAQTPAAMESAFMQAVLNGRINTHQEWLEYLEAFHRDVPAATSRPLAGLRDEHGRTSYEVLAQTVRETGASPHVLDLGCGDGNELFAAVRAAAPRARITGVDLSPAEIERANAQGRPDAEYIIGSVERLPFADASFDVALSHMAMMLVSPLEAAMRDIARVLRPGGRAAFIIDRADPQSSLGKLFSTAIAALRETYPMFVTPAIGDERIRDVEELRTIAAQAGFERTSLRVANVCVTGAAGLGSAAEVMQTMYVFASLPNAIRSKLFAQDSGAGTIEMPLQLIELRR